MIIVGFSGEIDTLKAMSYAEELLARYAEGEKFESRIVKNSVL